MSNTPNPIKRLYVISDNEMLQDSKVCHVLFIDDLPAFQGFDPMFDAAFALNWKNAVSTAEVQPTDEVYRDQLQTKTQSVQEAMANCRAKYNEVKYYVRKAFPTNAGVQQEFGLDNYDSVRKSDVLMRNFMIQLHKAADKYSAELTAPGINYSAPQIADIMLLADALDVQNIDQDKFKEEQQTATQNRITSMNNVWGFRTRVSEASKLIFAGDFAKYQQYLLPSTGTNSEDYAIEGSVKDSVTNLPIEGARVRISILGLDVFTNSLGKFGIADNVPPDTYSIDIEALDYAPQTVSVTVTSADETLKTNVALVHV